MIFQVLFAAATGACMFYFLIAVHRSAFQALFVVAFFGMGVLFILRPDLSSRVANLVGIGRGTDLVLYLSTLFLIFVAFSFHLRFRALEERQTDILRELALRAPVQEEHTAEAVREGQTPRR
jgi:small membrane protein